LPEIINPFEKITKENKKAKRIGVSEEGILDAHHMKVPKGYVPKYIKLPLYHQVAWDNTRRFIEGKMISPELEENLAKAHMDLRGEEYLAFLYFTTLLTFIIGIIVGIVMIILLSFSYPLAKAVLGGVFIIIALPGITYFILSKLPSMKASSRRRDIDKRISSAMSFIAAMGSSDVTIDVIFKELAKQKMYGEIANEALWITRDTEVLGLDIITAMKNAVPRSPSRKFQDFLQGAITTVTAGGQLKPYFILKAEEYERDTHLDMQRTIETLGMLAESYVTVVVAFPLFLIVILAIMAIVGSNGSFIMEILWMVVLVMIPVSDFGFIFIMQNMLKG